MAPTHLEILKQQIDVSAVDFSIFIRICGNPPTDDDYGDAVRYAQSRVRDRLEYIDWMYDRIDTLWQQSLVNATQAGSRDNDEVELVGERCVRLTVESLELNVDEEWITAVRKGLLQREIRAAVEARKRVEEERDRLFVVWEDATRAEKASRLNRERR